MGRVLSNIYGISSYNVEEGGNGGDSVVVGSIGLAIRRRGGVYRVWCKPYTVR